MTQRPSGSNWRRASIFAAAVSPALCGAAATAQIKGDRALGEYLASECAGCHQLGGKADGAIPSIVGAPVGVFIAQMNAYRRKERDNPVMRMIAGKFSDEEIAALAAYFEALKPHP